ncbi:hypothetical protein II898_01115 [bacterium]|nr:hypothetical protein [bacterium]
MKKYMLFFAVLLLSGILVAEEALSENSKDEFSAYYDRFFVQPTAGIGIIYFDIDINVALDVLVKRFDSGHRIYVGAEGGFRYMPNLNYKTFDVDPVTEFPIMGNLVFDFKTKNGLPEYASLWLAFGYSRMLIVPDPAESGEKSWCNSMSWGIGTALTFKNRLVLKMGVNGISVIVPTLTVAIGYRF